MSDNFAWVCICIMDGGHFSFLDTNANPWTTRLALRVTMLCCIVFEFLASWALLMQILCGFWYGMNLTVHCWFCWDRYFFVDNFKHPHFNLNVEIIQEHSCNNINTISHCYGSELCYGVCVFVSFFFYS